MLIETHALNLIAARSQMLAKSNIPAGRRTLDSTTWEPAAPDSLTRSVISVVAGWVHVVNLAVEAWANGLPLPWNFCSDRGSPWYI